MKKTKTCKMLVSAAMAIWAGGFAGTLMDGQMLETKNLIKNSLIENEILSLFQVAAMAEVQAAVIETASVGFVLGNSLVDPNESISDDEFFSNVVSQCTFHSQESFDPLCVICQLSDSDGNIVAQGIVGQSFDEGVYEGSSTVNIDLEPNPRDPLSNDPQKVQNVNIQVCGPLEDIVETVSNTGDAIIP
jgi:hypothetical protein